MPNLDRATDGDGETLMVDCGSGELNAVTARMRNELTAIDKTKATSMVRNEARAKEPCV